MTTRQLVAVVAWKTARTNAPLVEGLRRAGIRAELMTPRDALRRLAPGDVAIVRLDVREALDGVEPGLATVARLADNGVRVLNRPGPLLAAHDKWRTARCLSRAGIPHPWTIHRTRPRDIRELEPPFVLKPRFGSWGRDVMVCRNSDDVDRCLAILAGRGWFERHGVLVQELLPQSCCELRLIVAGRQVVGAARRLPTPGEWRANVALGGRSEPARPPRGACALAIRAAGALDTDLVSVDLLPLHGRRHAIVEVNGAAEFDGRDSLPARDLYRDAAAALELLPAAGARRHAAAARR